MNGQRIKSVDEKTRIPLGWLLVILTMSGSGLITAMGVGVWVSKVDFKNDSNEKSLSDLNGQLVSEVRDLKSLMENSRQDMQSIDRRLSHIEGAVGVKKNHE